MITESLGINRKIIDYLYQNDFPKYVLEKAQIYWEINESYNIFLILTVN